MFRVMIIIGTIIAFIIIAIIARKIVDKILIYYALEDLRKDINRRK